MKIFKSPRHAIRIVNIFFLLLILIYIAWLIFDLNTGRKSVDCLWTSGLVVLITLNSWVLSLRPFYDKIEKENRSKRR